MSKGKTTTVQEASLPAFQEAQFKELFSRAQGVAQQPFLPYTGPMVAGFSPDQLRQFQATRGMFETGMGYDPTKALQGMAQDQFRPTIQPVTGFQAPTIEATQAPGAAQIQPTPTFGGAQIGPVAGPSAAQISTVAGPTAARIEQSPLFGGAQIGSVVGPTAAQIGQVSTPQFQGLLSQDIGAYQSPFQQQVIDTAMQDIQRQADIARGGAQERAIRAGAFGGSRSALLESESQRPYAEQMARTAAGLRQSGFEQAQAAAERDVARQQQMAMFAPQFELQARQQQAGLLGGLQTGQLQGLGLLGGIGAQQQALQQRAIDAQRREFQRALAYPQQQIGLLQAGMGTPLVGTTRTESQKAGAGDILASVFGLFG